MKDQEHHRAAAIEALRNSVNKAKGFLVIADSVSYGKDLNEQMRCMPITYAENISNRKTNLRQLEGALDWLLNLGTQA